MPVICIFSVMIEATYDEGEGYDSGDCANPGDDNDNSARGKQGKDLIQCQNNFCAEYKQIGQNIF